MADHQRHAGHQHDDHSHHYGHSHGAGENVKDPVCGMTVDPTKAAATREHDGTTFYFCSAGCAETFDADPHRYGHGESHGHGGSHTAHHGH